MNEAASENANGKSPNTPKAITHGERNAHAVARLPRAAPYRRIVAGLAYRFAIRSAMRRWASATAWAADFRS